MYFIIIRHDLFLTNLLAVIFSVLYMLHNYSLYACGLWSFSPWINPNFGDYRDSTWEWSCKLSDCMKPSPLLSWNHSVNSTLNCPSSPSGVSGIGSLASETGKFTTEPALKGRNCGGNISLKTESIPRLLKDTPHQSP